MRLAFLRVRVHVPPALGAAQAEKRRQRSALLDLSPCEATAASQCRVQVATLPLDEEPYTSEIIERSAVG